MFWRSPPHPARGHTGRMAMRRHPRSVSSKIATRDFPMRSTGPHLPWERSGRSYHSTGRLMERMGRDEGQRPVCPVLPYKSESWAGTYAKRIVDGVRAWGFHGLLQCKKITGTSPLKFCNGDLEAYLEGLHHQEQGVAFVSFAFLGIFNSPGLSKIPGSANLNGNYPLQPEITRQ